MSHYEPRKEIAADGDSTDESALDEEVIRAGIAEAIAKNFGTACAKSKVYPLDFLEREGYTLPSEDIVNPCSEALGEEWYLKLSAGADGPGCPSSPLVDHVRSEDLAETLALVALLPEDDSLSLKERFALLADQYATYDELRRLAVLSNLILKRGLSDTLLKHFDHTQRELYQVNHEHVLLDKARKIEKMADNASLFSAISELIANESYLRELGGSEDDFTEREGGDVFCSGKQGNAK